MSAKIDLSQVRHIAKLSRLNLGDDEAHLFATQLGNILDYVQQLESVDVAGIEPLAHALPVVNVLREDTPQAPLPPDSALGNAPQREGAFFRVPAVLDQASGA